MVKVFVTGISCAAPQLVFTNSFSMKTWAPVAGLPPDPQVNCVVATTCIRVPAGTNPGEKERGPSGQVQVPAEG